MKGSSYARCSNANRTGTRLYATRCGTRERQSSGTLTRGGRLPDAASARHRAGGHHRRRELTTDRCIRKDLGHLLARGDVLDQEGPTSRPVGAGLQHQLPVGPLISSAQVGRPELASMSRMALADNAALARKPSAGLAAIRPPKSSSAWVEIKITGGRRRGRGQRTRDVQAAFTSEIDVDQDRTPFLRQA